MKKRLMASLLAACLCVGSVPAALAADGQPIGVQMNGETVTFDAQPEEYNSRTMVPFRAIMEKMGGEVGWEEATQKVSATVDGTTIYFNLGSTTLNVGDKQVQMDVAPYEKSGRTYVPVRFFADQYGYDVLWSEDSRTAVLVDKQAQIDSINENFTILNKLMKADSVDMEKTYRSVTDLSAVITLFDGSSTKATYPITAKMTALSQGMKMQCDVTMDLSALLKLMNGGTEPVGDVETIKALTTALSDMDVEIICDLDKGALYVKSEALITLLEEINGKLDGVSKDSWFLIDIAPLLGSTGGVMDLYSSVLSGGTMTMGDLLYAECRSIAEMTDPTEFYTLLNETTMATKAIAGDDHFTKSGSVYTLKANLDDLKKMLGADAAELEDAFNSFELNCTYNESNSYSTASFKMELADAGKTVMTMTMDAKGDNSNTTLEMMLEIADEGKLELTCKASMQPTSESVPSVPTTNVVDLSTLLGLGA